ncbi:TatD DNase family protein [Solirubrobacter pauli]|uniref:TatD DNase family protein n=1 Tax=Solirubrobacter pauli TaxID=166793 RepID=A0A660L283_9ACTN|nr:TatD DNase family protein [Solirubrobacter pauli]
MLPPIDAHAHIQTGVSARDIAGLKAFVVAVTRERKEWGPALRRTDRLAVWGVGVHPGLPVEISDFDQAAFGEAVERACFVGEIGLDGKSKASMDSQRHVLTQILEVVAARPRPTTIHSAAASGPVLNALRERPIRAPILHWWRGSEKQTREAVELGCYFSINGAEVRRPKVLSLLPPERVLTETDFPYSRRSDPTATQPAAVGSTERALMQNWGLDELALRRLLWQNLAELFDRCDLTERVPSAVQEAMLAAGFR